MIALFSSISSAVLRYSPQILVTLCLLLPLAACAGTPWAKTWERSLAADPRLQETPSATATPSPAAVQLPIDFPGEIPRYPNAELVGVTPPATSDAATQTRWSTPDSLQQVTAFYQQKLQSDGWQLNGTPPAGTAPQPLVAKRDSLTLTLTPSSLNGKTEFTLAYQFGGTAQGNATPPAQSASPSAADSSTVSSTEGFSDSNQAPKELQPYITDLSKLGVLDVRSAGDKSANASDFKPNQPITRREYARWLVAANNAIYANQPARQIRMGLSTDQPAFQDVSKTDPDFGAIQGLANAGLIPSPLSGSDTTVTFRPDAPLTREDLILWKVPLDLRRSLPNASIDAVQQTWGFQDAARIDPRALRAVQADYQNGDLANIRRAFGYTTLFQPKKPATRAEAAAVLWAFGSQGDSVSAKDALQARQAAAQSPSPAPAGSPEASPAPSADPSAPQQTLSPTTR